MPRHAPVWNRRVPDDARTLNRVGIALSTVPRAMNKGPIPVNFGETNHAVEIVPMFAPLAAFPRVL